VGLPRGFLLKNEDLMWNQFNDIYLNQPSEIAITIILFKLTQLVQIKFSLFKYLSHLHEGFFSVLTTNPKLLRMIIMSYEKNNICL